MTATNYRSEDRELFGMERFARWNHTRKGIADVDGIIHDARTNSFLMLEFKPQGSRVTRGQEITLTGFSKLPNCTAAVVFDPYWNDTSREAYDPDMLLKVIKFKDGQSKEQRITVRELNIQIDAWFGRM